MRWLGLVALLGACGTEKPPLPAGNVALQLALPHGALDPAGFASVDVVLHIPDQADDARTAAIVRGADGKPTFDLGTIEPVAGATVEATLRNDSGAAVGYGRTAVDAAIDGGAEIIVPVRRPIAYLAGTVSQDSNTHPNQPPMVHWTEAPATFSDLSTGGVLDGRTGLTSNAVMMVAAGPSLYLVSQATSDPAGMLTGAAKLVPVAAADHQLGAALAGSLTGAVLDGAGTDDGATLAIGTTTQLFAVDTQTGGVRALASGAFARVAVMRTNAGPVAIALKNRGPIAPACATTAELWWAPLDGTPATLVATGGFTDLAADRGHAYYVDACKRELGELTPTGVTLLRSLAGAASPTARPTALAVSNGQAYVGLEDAPATTALVVAGLATTEAASGGTGNGIRLLWSEPAQQVVDVRNEPEVRRQLNATGASIDHLELGAGGDYVALTTNAHFHGDELVDVKFPEMTIDAEELRVFDAATGGTVQRYRSWCDGVVLVIQGQDIGGWECSAVAGQTAAATSTLEHHLGSLAFVFGKK